MKLILNIALAAALAATASGALADTIYKCVQSDGKVAFSSLPCAGKAKQARQLTVPPPEADDVSAARLKQERAQLAVADKQFRQRHAMRGRGGDRGANAVADMSNVGPSKAEVQRSKAKSDQAEAARLNAARIGNCSMPRKEANCL